MSLPVQPRMREDLIVRQVEEDFVVYDPVSDRTSLLNLSAAVVFELCDGTRTKSDIAAALAETFNKARTDVMGDVEVALDEFKRQGFLQTESADPRGPGPGSGTE